MIKLNANTWYRIPAKLLQDHDLSAADIAVFAVIADMIDNDSRTIAISDIIATTGYSKSTVIRAIKQLTDKGYITVSHEHGKPSKYTQHLLPAKKRSLQKYSETKKQGIDPDVEKYKVLVNKF